MDYSTKIISIEEFHIYKHNSYFFPLNFYVENTKTNESKMYHIYELIHMLKRRKLNIIPFYDYLDDIKYLYM